MGTGGRGSVVDEYLNFGTPILWQLRYVSLDFGYVVPGVGSRVGSKRFGAAGV